MKTLWNFILLVGLVCLAGCGKDSDDGLKNLQDMEQNPEEGETRPGEHPKPDEKQSVAFDIHEINAGPDGTEVYVNIKSNCRWTMHSDSEHIRIGVKEGQQNRTFGLIIGRNLYFDDILGHLFIYSQDKTSSDTIFVKIGRNIALEVGDVGLIPEYAGTIDLPVRTNDSILSVETSPWISLISGRALRDSIYTFSVQPNTTGRIREGIISLKGQNLSESVSVVQDSYAPETVSSDGLPAAVSQRDFRVPLFTLPEYADMSKLETCHTGTCAAELSGSILRISVNDFGPFGVTVSSSSKVLHTINSELFPIQLFDTRLIREAYSGQDVYIDYYYYSKDYVLTSSRPETVTVRNNRSLMTLNTGSATVSAFHPIAGCLTEASIKVEPFLLEARIGGISQKADGSFDVSIAACVSGTNISEMGFIVLDKDGKAVSTKGTVRDLGMNRLGVSTTTMNVTHWTQYQNINEYFRGYSFLVEVLRDGVRYERSVPIDVMRVGHYY